MKKHIDVEQCSGCNPELSDRTICKCGREYEMIHLALDTIKGEISDSQDEDEVEEKAYFEHSSTKLLIDWGPQYMLGINDIDEQHKGIADLINRIHVSVNSGSRDHTFVLEILAELDKYVIEHFAFEEKLFKATKYPGYRQQMREHRMFSSQVTELHKEFEKSFFDLRSVLRFMLGWFMEHTQVLDKQFVIFWKSQLKKKS